MTATPHQRLELRIGDDVMCGSEVFGRLERVVVDPVADYVRHLVVDRRHLHHQSVLVPVGLVDREEGRAIFLRSTACDPARLAAYEPSAHVAPAQGWRSAGRRAYARGEAVFTLGGQPKHLKSQLVVAPDSVPAMLR